MSDNYSNLYAKIKELMLKSGYKESVEPIELTVESMDKLPKAKAYTLVVNNQSDVVHYYGESLPNWTQSNVSLIFAQSYSGQHDLFAKKDNANYIKDILRNPINWSDNIQFTVDENIRFLYKKDTVLLSELNIKYTFKTYVESYDEVDDYGNFGYVTESEDWGDFVAVTVIEDWGTF